MLASRLIERGFDTAYAHKPLHHPLGHAFTNAIFYLDYNRRGFEHPIVPFAVNCYGRKVVSQRGGIPVFDRLPRDIDFDPPRRRLGGCSTLAWRPPRSPPYRVALLASSGWSHAFLTAKNHYLYPDTPADRRMYEHLRDGNYRAWRDYPGQAVEDSGQQEILKWMCLVGAILEDLLDRASSLSAAVVRGSGHYDVIVAGAGPVGLTLTIDLGRRGIRCVIMERDPTPAPWPKMDRSNARTMEFYRRIGIVDRIRALGYRPTIRWTYF
jgi:hypothetical protein